jgi:TetR/AcrR family transcriptional regulator, fatty acid metabolism regulator protein
MRSDSQLRYLGSPDARELSFIERTRRAQIINSAIEVIAGAGYAGASLAAIAQHAEVSKGVISYHFAGKDDLMERVVDAIYADIGASVKARLDAAPSASEKVRAHVTAIADHMEQHRNDLSALGQIFSNFRTPDGKQRYGMHTSAELLQVLDDIYAEGQRNGEFRAFDTRVMAVTHQSAVEAMFAYWDVHPDIDLSEYADSLVDLLTTSASTTRRKVTRS